MTSLRTAAATHMQAQHQPQTPPCTSQPTMHVPALTASLLQHPHKHKLCVPAHLGTPHTNAAAVLGRRCVHRSPKHTAALIGSNTCLAKEQTLHSANIAITGRHALHSARHVSAHSPCHVPAQPSSNVYMRPCLTKLTTQNHCTRTMSRTRCCSPAGHARNEGHTL